MLVRVLGGVSLVSPEGSVIRLPGSRQPALLAALAARVGQVVSADLLVDLLWDASPPENPAAALHSAVFKLRANLARATERDVLVTRERGYLLDLETQDLDSAVFTRVVEESRRLPAEQAVKAITDGLVLWRGRAYDEFADTEIAHLEALRLEELRLSAIESCAEAMLVAGRSAEAISLLPPFVTEHPLREGARTSLMRALADQGRTADALEQFQQHRAYLADELGLEPSGVLAQVQEQLLRGQQPPPAGGPALTQNAPGQTPAGGLQGMQVRYLRARSGNVLAYGTTGAGARLVVILGWVSSLHVIASGRDARSSLLQRLAGAVSLTLYDRRGTGLSPGPVDDYGLEASVAELGDVIEAIGPPVSLMAMSAAGPIALTLAHRRPEWVDSLVLFGTFSDGPRTFPDVALRQMIVELVRTHWGMGSKMLADLYRPGLSDQAAWHLAKMFRDSADPEVAAAYLESMYEQDVNALLPAIEAPALVLHYRRDRLIGFKGGQDLAAGLPNATFFPLDGRFHLPDAADLDAIQQAIVRHVRRYATSR